MRMLSTLVDDPVATCMLVEVIASKSQNINWSVSIDKKNSSREQIRRVSIDKFYEIVTGDKFAFKKLCIVLPAIIEDVVASVKLAKKSNTVVGELKAIDSNLLKSIYLLSFRKYEGFHDFTL